jgi:hypothetical protein
LSFAQANEEKQEDGEEDRDDKEKSVTPTLFSFFRPVSGGSSAFVMGEQLCPYEKVIRKNRQNY